MQDSSSPRLAYGPFCVWLLAFSGLGTTLHAQPAAGEEAAVLFANSFDTSGSILNWAVQGDAFAEATLSWQESAGNPDGALNFEAFHNGNGEGRGYILTYTVARTDMTGASRLEFDTRLTGASIGTNLQVQIILPGIAPDFKSLSNEGLNADTWTRFSYDLSAVESGSENLTLNFLVAAGAFEGAGIAFALDNLEITGTAQTGGGGDEPTILYLEPFEAEDALDPWMVAEDSFNETTLSWLAEGGIPGGAMQFGGYHAGQGGGRGYILSRTLTDFDFTDATQLAFDAKLTGTNVGDNIQVQIVLPGVSGVFATLTNGGLNNTTWTEFAYDISGVEPGPQTLTVNFLLAAGAFEGAGAVFAIDNFAIRGAPANNGGGDDGTYLGYTIVDDWIDTGEWMGLLWVKSAPWLYQTSLGWIWMAEDSYSPGVGSWIFVPETN